MRTSFIKTGEQKNMVLGEDMRTWFLERHENRRTCFLEKTWEQENRIFWKDRRTREHEKKCKGLLEQNENKRFGWALPNTPFLRYPHLNHWILHFSLFTFHLTYGFFTFHSSLNISFACSFHRTQTTQKLFLF